MADSRGKHETTLVVTDPRAMGLIGPSEARTAIAAAFRSAGDMDAESLERRRIYISLGDGEYLWHNTMAGWHSPSSTLAVRIDVARVSTPADGTMQFPGNFSGFVMLFASDTCAPYAIIHDHLLSPTRVAATSALASGLLARPASEVLGLIGGGEQALAHIDSHLDLFPALREIRVFIRTESSRSALEGRLSSRWNIDIKAVDTAREAVVACDIVIACTNAKSPVFSGSWLAPGQHVVTVASPDKFIRRQEIDAETVRRADIVMVNSVRQIAEDCQQPLLGLIESGQIMQNNLLELPIALKSDAPVRTGSDQITLYDNNVGMGVQFAALGKLLVERAIENGYVSEIPADIFLTRRTSESDRFAP